MLAQSQRLDVHHDDRAPPSPTPPAASTSTSCSSTASTTTCSAAQASTERVPGRRSKPQDNIFPAHRLPDLRQLRPLPRAAPRCQRPLKVLFVASECAPFAKTGGLADVAGALPKALRAAWASTCAS